MNRATHYEKHFTSSETVRDIVIGMADGLTVPFALAAGLAGAVDAANLVIQAGLAEVAAGSIAMGLGGYLAARSEAEHYINERARERIEIVEKTADERAEVRAVFVDYGLTETQAEPIVDALAADPEKWVDFMMRFELGLEEPDPKRARISALTIAGAYIFGGMIPLSPYFFSSSIMVGLQISIALTLLALLVFGYVKGRFTSDRPWRSAWQTMGVGGLAALAAWSIARAIG